LKLSRNSTTTSASATSKNIQAFRRTYARAQYITNTMNTEFFYYFEWFSSTLLVSAAIMTYGGFRFLYLSPHAYASYPACAIRCLTEVFALLALAGDVNLDSRSTLAQWKQNVKFHQTGRATGELKRNLLLRSTLRACPEIRRCAGQLYTFEKSIVICNMHNYFALTMNLCMLTS